MARPRATSDEITYLRGLQEEDKLIVAREDEMSRVKDLKSCCSGTIKRANGGERDDFPAGNRGDRAATPRDSYRRFKSSEESSVPMANRRGESSRNPSPGGR